MLVLSRRKNESLVIGNDITIVIVEIRGDKVRLGIEAPKEVPVHRTEVYQAIRRCTAEDYYEPCTPVPRDERRGPTELSPELTTVAVRDAEPTPRDGLCCPQCQSDDVRVERIKVAYQGAELVRWRKCGVCGNRFQTLEKVQEL